MKKYLLTLLILSTFSLSSNAFLPEKLPNFEQLVSEVDLAKKNKPPKTPSLGKTLGKGYIATKVWKHKGKIAIVGIGGLIVYGISKSKFLDIISNPDEHQEYIQEMLEDKLKTSIAFQSVVFYNYLKTDDTEFKEQLEYFIDYFNLISKAKSAQHAADMLTTQYTDIKKELLKEAQKIRKEWEDNNGPNRCNNNFYHQLAFSENFRPTPDVVLGSGFNLYDVNSHGILKDDTNTRNKLTSDHIPSYKAIEVFLTNKGIVINGGRTKNPTLVSNLTGILVNRQDHADYSITFSGNNKRDKFENDAKNLFDATIRDISYFAYKLNAVNSNESKIYLKNSLSLISRNFYLCLYN